MRVRKYAALLLALLFAVSIVPHVGSAADMEYEVNYGEYFSIFLWEGCDPVDDLAVISGSLPPGVHIIRNYNDSSNSYYFYAAGAPTAMGTYFAQIEIRPNGAMYSSFTLEITVIKPIKIKTKTLPQATEGEYYQAMIETNYSYTEVELVEIWNPGVGVVLPYLGLELAENGAVYGTPKRSGTYYIYVGASCKSNMSYDEAMIKLVIEKKDEPDPTDPPEPGPVAPDCLFNADSVLYYEPGAEFDWLLLTVKDSAIEVGTVELPVFMDINFYKSESSLHLKGVAPKDSGAGVYELLLPLTAGGKTWYVHYLIKPFPASKLGGYPAASGLPVGF